MVTLAKIIDPIYRKFQPALSKKQIILDLDIKNPEKEVENSAYLRKLLINFLEFSRRNSSRTRIIISSNREELTIKDENSLLSPEIKSIFADNFTSVRSRVGFGTTIKTKLTS